MMEENPILLWSIKCYKQKASDKSDPHTMFYLYTFNVYSLLLVLVWNSFKCDFQLWRDSSPLCHFSFSWIVHGFHENVVIEFFVLVWWVFGFCLFLVCGFILFCFFLPVERWNQVRFFIYIVTSDKELTGQFILSVFTCAAPSFLSSVRLMLEYVDQQPLSEASPCFLL